MTSGSYFYFCLLYENNLIIINLVLPKPLLFRENFLIFISILCVGLFCHMYLPHEMPSDARNYKSLCTTMWVQGTEPRSSGEASHVPSILNCRVISSPRY